MQTECTPVRPFERTCDRAKDESRGFITETPTPAPDRKIWHDDAFIQSCRREAKLMINDIADRELLYRIWKMLIRDIMNRWR